MDGLEIDGIKLGRFQVFDMELRGRGVEVCLLTGIPKDLPVRPVPGMTFAEPPELVDTLVDDGLLQIADVIDGIVALFD